MLRAAEVFEAVRAQITQLGAGRQIVADQLLGHPREQVQVAMARR